VDEELARYYFLGGGSRTADWTRLRPLVVVGLSIGIAVVWRSPFVLAVSAILAACGVLALLRPGRPGLYVELLDEHLNINLLFRTRVRYDNISSADHPIMKHGILMRIAYNCAVAINRIAGGDYPWAPNKGEADTTTVEVKFRRAIWTPLLLFPRKSWRLTVENAESLRSELVERLGNESATGP
jgi:hypothetical protein